MTYLEKLIKLEGKKPETLAYHQKMTRLKTEESAAKNLFKTLMTDSKEKAKAKKLGLL